MASTDTTLNTARSGGLELEEPSIEQQEPPYRPAGLRRAVRFARDELSGVHFRLISAQLIGALLPTRAMGRIRARLLHRVGGLSIGRGTAFAGMPAVIGGRQLRRQLLIGSDCWFNIGCTFDVHADVVVQQGVRFGHEVMVLTQTHDIGLPGRRAGNLRVMPVRIGAGVWIGARATILPGVTIGRGAVVAAGAVVTEDVPDNTLAGGIPAKVLRTLD